MKRTTLSFLTESKGSHVSLSSFRRVAITLLVMLLTTASAIAQNSYWLTLDPNYEGGASTMVPVSISANTITLTKNFEPTRTGYTFYGWSKSPTGTVEYRTNDKITLGGNLTLYAIWDDSPYPYKLIYSVTDEDSKQAELSGYKGNAPTGALDISSTAIINGTKYSVASIANYAFSGCSNLQSVNIPNSVTSIGNSAFEGCSNLMSINIPNSVTDIGYYAFSGCSNLQSVTIPNSVTSIGFYAFRNCSSLQSVTINGNPKIGTDAFWGILANVTMNLTASKIDGDYWTTFYNDGYNFQADEYTKVYKGTVNESSLMLTEVEDKIVNRGTAVILKSSGNPVMTLTESGSNDTNGNDLRGITNRSLRTDVMYWYGANAIYTMGNTSAGFGFHKYTGEYVPAGKAFLPLNIANGAKAILTMVFADVTTGVKSVSSDNEDLQNDWFSLDGTRLSGKPSQPGIYVNGKKKIVIK